MSAPKCEECKSRVKIRSGQELRPYPARPLYIVSRQSGGRLGWFYDLVKDRASHVNHSEWFALYPDDGQIDDYTDVDGVRRRNFRIHLNGRFGLSEGCITIAAPQDFNRLRQWLLSQPTGVVPRSGGLRYYGVVTVK